MKKILIILFVAITLVTISGCEATKTDAEKFKEEYESLNNKENGNYKIRSLSISKDNPIIYKTADEISDMIDNKETFVVYFGFPSCPWCRSMLETLFKVAEDNKISKIYYVNVLDIRDVKELDENNEVKTTKKGTNGYNKLLERLSDLLDDYELATDDDNKISTGEKRIYAPNVVAIVNGKPTKLVEGISEKQTDPYQELTEEMKDDMYNQLECVIKCLSKKNTCSKTGC